MRSRASTIARGSATSSRLESALPAIASCSEGYFTTMGIPLIRGRLFDERDGPDAPHVAVISESLAATKWPNQDPIGRFVQFGNMDGDLRGFRIVGVVGDVREISPETLPGPLFYGYYRQRMATRFSVVLRTTMAGSIAPTARQVARQIDPDLPVQIRTVEDAFDRALAGRRFSLTLIVVFSAAGAAPRDARNLWIDLVPRCRAHPRNRNSPCSRSRVNRRLAPGCWQGRRARGRGTRRRACRVTRLDAALEGDAVRRHRDRPHCVHRRRHHHSAGGADASYTASSDER